MSTKIERVERDILKTQGKISELNNRLHDLEQKKNELENIEIVDIVRGMNISLSDLAAVLTAAKNKTITSGQVGPKSNLKEDDKQ